jgi:hypothetical protein
MLLHITVLVQTFADKINTIDLSFKESILPRNFMCTVFMYLGFPVKKLFHLDTNTFSGPKRDQIYSKNDCYVKSKPNVKVRFI